MSEQENRLYLKGYGIWAADPIGASPDYRRCCATVVRSRELPRQCSKLRGWGPDKAYCKHHDPARVKEKSDAAERRYNEAWRQRRYEVHGRGFFAVLEKIAAGYNDARGLAQKAVDEFRKGEG